MTKHIRKEHPAEPIQDDQDAEYSDVEPSDDDALEDDTDDIKEEADSPYQDSIDLKDPRLSRPLSGYHANLWPLPGQTAQRPNPVQLQRSTIPRSEASVHEIKLERPSSATPMRSLTDPYSNGSMRSAGPNSVPMHPTLPHNITTSAMTQQYQFRSHDNSFGLWSPSHDSPTSLGTSSPSSASTQGHPIYTSQPYQQQSTSLPSHEQMQYSQDGMIRNIQQPMNDLAVHEIHLDQPQPHQYRDMASTPVQQQQQQYDGTPHHVSQQDQYISMSRDSSQHHSYAEAPPQAAIHYMGSVPPTPAPQQAISQYATTFPEEAPYYPPEVPMGNFPIGGHYSLPGSEVNQITQSSPDWLEQFKPAHLWPYQLLPNERIERWGQ